MRKTINYIYVSIFSFIFLAPLLQMYVPFISIKKLFLDERREMRQLNQPLLRWVNMDSGLAEDMNGWFDDHYGFREFFIRINNELSYQLFNYSDKVYIGRNSWLFDKETYSIVLEDADNFQIEKKIVSNLRLLKKYFNSIGITLVVVLNPNKSSIYPEYLPPSLPRPAKTRLLQRLSILLENEPGLIFINSEKILKENKDKKTFYQTDLHINSVGSYLVYTEMIRRIALDQDVQLSPFSVHGWKRDLWSKGSDERYIAKLFRIGEINESTGNHLSSFKDDKFGKWQFNVGEGIVRKSETLPLYDWIFINKQKNARLLPPILIFGSSFTDGFFGLKLNEQFKAVYRTKSNIPARMQPIFQNMPAVKYIVIESPEMHLRNISLIPTVDNHSL